MLALYRSGRQAEALEAYRHAREVLVGELGLEPGAELRRLHEAILAHDPALVAPAESGTPPLHRVLPTLPNRTIGREHEVTAVGARLRAEPVRLLTLTGPGGVGKTRLAVEVARSVEAEFGGGAAFVSLAAVQRADEVPAAIAGTLEIALMAGESPADGVERYLRDRQLLLVADNFEHVLDAAPFVAGLLDACPAVTVLATSREPLALAAEERFPVAPIAAADAVALFAERARGIDPGFALDERSADAVAEICRRLDGLPLAIELAAARCGLLSPAELAERLGDALGALGEGARDAPARQRTLRAAIEWSHDLLNEDEQEAFAHFAVFAGAPDVEAAEAITGAGLDTLDRLLAKSLLVRRRSARSATRLAMLETIRSFAVERLAARSDAEAVRERHFRHYLEVAERHGSDRALWGAGHRAHLAELDACIDDLHGAMGWAVRRSGGHEALRLCAALSWYWLARDRYLDAMEWSGQALSLPGTDADAVLRARVLCLVAACLWGLGRAAEQPPILAEAEALARSHADPVQLARVLESRSVFASGVGTPDVANAYAEEALSLAGLDDWTSAMAARARVLATQPGAQLHERVDRAVSLLERAGNHFHLVSVLASAAYGALVEGSYAQATAYIERALPIARGLDNPHMWMLVRGNEAMAVLLAGDLEAARFAFREELRLCRDLGFVPFVYEGLRGLAAIAAADGDDDRVARLCGAAERHRHGQPDDAAQARLDVTFDSARARCGADAWDAAFRAGGELGVGEAIAYAIGEPGG
jgi:predicted ATPase